MRGLRSLAGERALGVAVVIFGAAVAFGVWFLASRPEHTIVRSRTTPGIVVVQPSTTPLRDSIREPKRKRRSRPFKKARGRSGQTIQSAPPASGTPKSPTRTGTKKRATTGTPKRPTGAQGQPSSTPPPSPQPQPQPQPQPGVTIPLPSVCTQPIKIGTCP